MDYIFDKENKILKKTKKTPNEIMLVTFPLLPQQTLCSGCITVRHTLNCSVGFVQ